MLHLTLTEKNKNSISINMIKSSPPPPVSFIDAHLHRLFTCKQKLNQICVEGENLVAGAGSSYVGL